MKSRISPLYCWQLYTGDRKVEQLKLDKIYWLFSAIFFTLISIALCTKFRWQNLPTRPIWILSMSHLNNCDHKWKSSLIVLKCIDTVGYVCINNNLKHNGFAQLFTVDLRKLSYWSKSSGILRVRFYPNSQWSITVLVVSIYFLITQCYDQMTYNWTVLTQKNFLY